MLKKIDSYSLTKRIYSKWELFEFVTYIIPSLPKTTVLAGGAFRCLFDKKETIHDFDLFYSEENTEDFDAAIAIFEQDNRYKVMFKCPTGKLVTFKDDLSKIKIQIIKNNKFGDVLELLNSFDFNACRFAWFKNNFFYSKQSIKDVKTKKLSLYNLTFPVATLKRVYKYATKGYQINDCLAEIVKTLNNPNFALTEENLLIYID